jgi:ferrous iron transport protein B
MNKTTIAIVGNPNCGKTTLFNGLTGGNIRTGNWPGVTVEKREGTLKYENNNITVVDLPGIYSFSAYSEDEKIARDYILSGDPALILNIIDATNFERNLYLTTQLIEMKVPIIIVLNMMDIAEKQNININIDELSKKLSLPVIGISAINKKDIGSVKSELNKYIKDPIISNAEVKYPNEVEAVIGKWQDDVLQIANDLTIDSRWIAIKLLENDSWVKEHVINSGCLSENEINEEQNKIDKILKDSPDIICADYRYGFIHGVSKQTVKKVASRQTVTDKIDKVILNRVLGIPIFLIIMYLVFWTTITVGGVFIGFFDIFFGTLFVDGFGTLLETWNTPEWLKIFLADGIGGGIQTVATFVPIIFMMFFMLSILEDSGYMARAAFVMDRFMKLLGLPGKSFVPLLVGFGCTVPAVMATRTLESKKDRLLTVFMAPFMSCGARLPVYALFVAAFFPRKAGLIVFSIYLIGIIFAVLTGLLMKSTFFKGKTSFFIMELPPYHRPRLKHILIHSWDRLKGFILRAGKIIVFVVIVLSFLNSLGTDGSFGNEDSNNSVLAKIGKTITPIFKPMGIEEKNWPATVGLFTGIFAKEAVVGTLNSLYGQIAASEDGEGEEEEEFDFWSGIIESFQSIPEGLIGIFSAITDPLGLGLIQEEDQEALAEEIGAETSLFGQMHSYFSKGKPQAFAYLLFILLYFPCVAAFGATVKETGVIFGILNAIYLTLLGWIVATLFYQVTVGHNILWIILPLAVMAVVIIGLYITGKIKQFKIEDLD